MTRGRRDGAGDAGGRCSSQARGGGLWFSRRAMDGVAGNSGGKDSARVMVLPGGGRVQSLSHVRLLVTP